jgi:hypothetical protein
LPRLGTGMLDTLYAATATLVADIDASCCTCWCCCAGDAVEFLRKYNVPMLVTGGGGYTKRNVAR